MLPGGSFFEGHDEETLKVMLYIKRLVSTRRRSELISQGILGKKIPGVTEDIPSSPTAQTKATYSIR